MVIGDRLRELREQKKFSQGDIEHRTGLLRCYISRVENGHTVPAIETLEKLARALEVPMYQLFYDGAKPPKVPNLLARKSEHAELIDLSSYTASLFCTLFRKWRVSFNSLKQPTGTAALATLRRTLVSARRHKMDTRPILVTDGTLIRSFASLRVHNASALPVR
jgi:transcriptional regulator with XRE-family HTH domain